MGSVQQWCFNTFAHIRLAIAMNLSNEEQSLDLPAEDKMDDKEKEGGSRTGGEGLSSTHREGISIRMFTE